MSLKIELLNGEVAEVPVAVEDAGTVDAWVREEHAKRGLLAEHLTARAQADAYHEAREAAIAAGKTAAEAVAAGEAAAASVPPIELSPALTAEQHAAQAADTPSPAPAPEE